MESKSIDESSEDLDLLNKPDLDFLDFLSLSLFLALSLDKLESLDLSSLKSDFESSLLDSFKLDDSLKLELLSKFSSKSLLDFLFDFSPLSFFKKPNNPILTPSTHIKY